MSRNRDQWAAPRALLGLLLVLLAALSPAATAGAAAGAPRAVRVNNQAQPPRLPVKAHGYYRHTSVLDLHWSGWGQAAATATGTFAFQFCVDESCSLSPFFVDPAAVSLSAIKRCRGRLSYTRLELRVEGLLPDSSFDRFRAKVGSCRG